MERLENIFLLTFYISLIIFILTLHLNELINYMSLGIMFYNLILITIVDLVEIYE